MDITQNLNSEINEIKKYLKGIFDIFEQYEGICEMEEIQLLVDNIEDKVSNLKIDIDKLEDYEEDLNSLQHLYDKAVAYDIEDVVKATTFMYHNEEKIEAYLESTENNLNAENIHSKVNNILTFNSLSYEFESIIDKFIEKHKLNIH